MKKNKQQKTHKIMEESDLKLWVSFGMVKHANSWKALTNNWKEVKINQNEIKSNREDLVNQPFVSSFSVCSTAILPWCIFLYGTD